MREIETVSGCSAVGSASGLGPGGRRFESCHPDNAGSSRKLGLSVFISHAGIDESILKIARDKFACHPMDLYDRGILCGMCMYIAVSNKRQIITVFSIMTFILCGFRHCIADFPFLIMNFSYMNLLKFIMIVLGNSMGAIVMNFLTNDKKYA